MNIQNIVALGLLMVASVSMRAVDSFASCAGFVSGSGIIQLWDFDSGNCLRILETTVDEQGIESVNVWSGDRAELMRTFNGHLESWSPDGASIIIASDNVSRVFDVNSGDCLGAFEDKCMLNWSPDGTKVALSPLDESGERFVGEFQLYSSDFTKQLGAVAGYFIAWNHDGTKLAFNAENGRVNMVDFNKN